VRLTLVAPRSPRSAGRRPPRLPGRSRHVTDRSAQQ